MKFVKEKETQEKKNHLSSRAPIVPSDRGDGGFVVVYCTRSLIMIINKIEERRKEKEEKLKKICIRLLGCSLRHMANLNERKSRKTTPLWACERVVVVTRRKPLSGVPKIVSQKKMKQKEKLCLRDVS